MLIDWFTVGAQVINFVILVWLLKRFLYKPVLNAIDAREKRVAATVKEADAQMTEAKAARDELRAKSKAFDEARGALLAAAIHDANVEAERLLDNARHASDALTVQRNAALNSETARLSDKLTRLAVSESIDIARAVLRDLAGADLEARISEVFTRRLRGMDPKIKATLAPLLTDPTSKPVVASSFELSPADRIAIQTALNETFSADINLRFETATNAMSGIELSAGGHRLSWSMADYLKTLEGKVAGLLSAEGIAAGTPAIMTPVTSTNLAAA